jgi:hypothetical protein
VPNSTRREAIRSDRHHKSSLLTLLRCECGRVHSLSEHLDSEVDGVLQCVLVLVVGSHDRLRRLVVGADGGRLPAAVVTRRITKTIPMRKATKMRGRYRRRRTCGRAGSRDADPSRQRGTTHRRAADLVKKINYPIALFQEEYFASKPPYCV